MKIELKKKSLVVLVGAMGTGKSTFVNSHFNHYDVIATDNIRYQLTGDFEYQYQNKATFKILYATIEARVEAGIFTIIDSTGSRSVLQRARDIAVKNDFNLVLIKFPHLKESELTKERMKHRMSYIDAYHRQVKRIDETQIQKEYEVIEIDDINDVQIEFEESYREKVTLDSQYKYVVIPDLHGEYKVLEHYIEKYKDEHNSKFIFLGDLVDRGESSYRTFQLADGLIKSGKAFGVISNHDNKLYRYFKKWKRDPSFDKHRSVLSDKPPTYGMTLAHGLEKTMKEFYELHNHDMDNYAQDFIDYYKNLNVYLFLDREKSNHFFAHAGITRNIARNDIINKGDKELVLYETLQDGYHVGDVFGNEKKDKGTVVHIGHNFKHLKVKLLSNDEGYALVMHDIGIGKRRLTEMPEFIEV